MFGRVARVDGYTCISIMSGLPYHCIKPILSNLSWFKHKTLEERPFFDSKTIGKETVSISRFISA